MTQKKSKIFPAILALMLAVTSSGCALLPQEEELVPPPLKEPAKITYDTVTVEKVPSLEKSIVKIGYFKSATVSDAYFTMQPGKLYKLYVRVNDTVKKGDIIAELENDSIQANVEKQKLTLQSLKIDLDAAKVLAEGGGNLAKQKATIDIYKQKLEDLHKAYEDAVNANQEAEKERIKQQIKEQENTIKLAEMDYETALKNAKDTYNKALINYQLNQQTLETLEKQLEACLLRAPVSGIVTYVKPVSVGETIQTYDTIASISNPDDLIIWCNAGDAKNALLTGTKLNVRLTDINTGIETTYTGKVTRTFSEMTAEEKAQAGADDLIYIKLDTTPKNIKVGQSATLSMKIWEVKDVIAIESYLLNEVGTNTGVYTVNVLENGIPVQRTVVPAEDANGNILANATMTVIKSGLEVGDQIIK